jgi:hypothetical protein
MRPGRTARKGADVRLGKGAGQKGKNPSGPRVTPLPGQVVQGRTGQKAPMPFGVPRPVGPSQPVRALHHWVVGQLPFGRRRGRCHPGRADGDRHCRVRGG